VAPDFLADLPIMALVFRNCNPNMTIEPKLAARLEEGDILWAMD